MNSPPPPSFTVPTLSSKGQYPVTPEESPTGNEEGKDYVSAKSKGKEKASVEDVEVEGRVSMYVRLFEGKSSSHSSTSGRLKKQK